MNASSLESVKHLKYRPDIDGLRAVAVLAVILHHAWPKWFASGFIGVDIFFVISGYLISSIILSQVKSGRFSIFEFYSRRVRRIFPALILVLLATIIFGWFVLLQGEFRQIGKHVAAGGGFISNIIFWFEAGYFDNTAETKPLLHLWSLGVEEQFYVVWPLILWVVFTKKYNFIYVASVIFLFSMSINVTTSETNPTAAFFSPVTRFWELMSGGFAAYLHLHHKAWTEHGKRISSIVGTIFLVIGFTLITPQVFFPSWWAILPVFGSVLLIMAGPTAIVNRQLLSKKAPVFVGLISYPLYLWHWPLLSFGYIVYGGKPSYLIKLILLCAAFVLAYVTYRLLEVPIRSIQRQATVTRVLSVCMAAIVILGVFIYKGVVRERIDVHGADVYMSALNDSDFPGPRFSPFRHNNIVFQKITNQGPGLTVFLGDSFVEQYGPYIEHITASNSTEFNSVIFATAGGCPPILHTIRIPIVQFPLCPATIEAAYDLASQPDVDSVVIGAAWYGYFSKSSQQLMFNDNGVTIKFPDTVAIEGSYKSLMQSIALLRAHGKRVFLILPPPSGPAYDPRNMYEGSRFESIHPVAHINDMPLDEFLLLNAISRNRLLNIAREAGAKVIEPSDFLCSKNICPVLDSDGTPAYTDAGHMRPKYSRKSAVFLRQTISK